MSENIYIEIRNETCIICLEKMNLVEDYLTPVCVKCDVVAHVSCLNEWYQKKNKKVCPICLKTEQYYLKYLKQKNQIQNNQIQNTNNYSENNDEGSDEESDEESDNNNDNNNDNNININDETELIINNYYRLNNDIISRFRCKIMCLCILFIFVTFYFFSIYHY
tara:strand:- start:1076 stop:1567 length:492 start_codon:yes stop_codon:yes gene_type:complete